jgi:hypothetical protein
MQYRRFLAKAEFIYFSFIRWLKPTAMKFFTVKYNNLLAKLRQRLISLYRFSQVAKRSVISLPSALADGPKGARKGL